MTSNALKGFPSVPCWQGHFFSEKNTAFPINSGHKTAAAIVSYFGRGGFSCGRGGCGYRVTMLTMQTVGNGGGGRVEGLSGGGKGERNGRQRDDNW